MGLDLHIIYCILACIEENNRHDWLDATLLCFSMTPAFNVVHDQISREKMGGCTLECPGDGQQLGAVHFRDLSVYVEKVENKS